MNMRMLTATALAAVAVMCASCGKSLNPEAQQAWDEFKTTANAVNNNEALQAFDSYEDYHAATLKWKDAVQKVKTHLEEYPKEIVDSINAIKEQTRTFRLSVREAYETERKAMQSSADQDTIQSADKPKEEPKVEPKDKPKDKPKVEPKDEDKED